MQRKRAANLVTNIYESITRNNSITQLEPEYMYKLVYPFGASPGHHALVHTASIHYDIKLLCLAT